MRVIKLELLIGVLTFALWVYCLVGVISTPDGSVRHLSKTIWILIVLFFPLAGSVAWLVAGRPEHGPRRPRAHEREAPEYPEYDRPGRAAAGDPERDETFLRQVRARAEKQRRRYDQQRRACEQEPEQPPLAEEP